MKKLVLFLLALLIGTIGIVVGIYYITCHGQCGHGDRECQNICLERNYCPHVEKQK